MYHGAESSNDITDFEQFEEFDFLNPNEYDNGVVSMNTVSNSTGSISLNYNSYYLQRGKALQLTATTDPSGLPVTWSVDKPAIISVDSTGRVSALAVGDAFVIVRCNELDLNIACSIHVMDVGLENSSPIVAYGDSYLFTAYPRPSTESISFTAHSNVTMSSTGTPNSVLISSSSIGNYYVRSCITGHSNIYKMCTVKFVPKVIFNSTNISLFVGDSFQNGVTVTPSGYNDVTWTSLDPGIATVDSTGKIVAVSPGRARIKVVVDQAPDATAVMIVTVKERILVSSISIPSYITVTAGTTYSFDAVVSPSNATDKRLEWSSDSALATINDGLLTAYYPGTATITVTSRDGNATATCYVNIVYESGGGSTSKQCVFTVLMDGYVPTVNSADVLISHTLNYVNQPFYDFPMNLLDRGTYITHNIMCRLIYNAPSQYPNPVFNASVSTLGEYASYTNGINSASFTTMPSHDALPAGHTHFEEGIAHYLRCGAWAERQKLSNGNPITVTYGCTVSCPDALFPESIEGTYTFTPHIDSSLLN